MRHTTARLGVIVGTLAAAVSIAPSAMAAPEADKELCESGGYANYVDPTTDLPFKNQGRCVSFLNGGGTLVPVQEEPPVPVAPTVQFLEMTWVEVADGYRQPVQLQGQPNTTYDLVLQVNDDPSLTYPVTTDADGLAAFQTTGIPGDGTYTVSYRGQVIGSVIAPAAPVEEPPVEEPVEEGIRASVAATPNRPGYFTFSATGLSPNGDMRLLLRFSGGYTVSQPGVADADGNWTSNPTSLSCAAIPTYTVEDHTTGAATPVAPALTPTDC